VKIRPIIALSISILGCLTFRIVAVIGAFNWAEVGRGGIDRGAFWRPVGGHGDAKNSAASHDNCLTAKPSLRLYDIVTFRFAANGQRR